VADFSVLIGGKAGFGIDRAGFAIANILNQMGYCLYIYRDYPSIIRGGHTFSLVRAAARKIAAHKDRIDTLIALNQDAFSLHKDKLTRDAVVIYDSDSVNIENAPPASKTAGLPITKILKEENAPEIMRNSCVIGAFCKAAGISPEILEGEFRKDFPEGLDLNLKVARRGYDAVSEIYKIKAAGRKRLPIFTGNEATALGLVKGGLETYISYPMTPSSPILHYLAALADEFSLKVIHPESEISVMLMALGAAYCGEKAAVGTSGGGFCLMTEGLSFSAMAELPAVIVLGQRPGPSTGLPTYSAQTELHFALNAGQGEFPRLVIAPGDAEEAYYMAQVALNIAWKCQVPAIILTDKNLGEGVYSFDSGLIPDIKEDRPILWDRKSPYKRYSYAENGVSPLAFAPAKDNVIKINSYEHDELGLTTEDPAETEKMQAKRLSKEKYLRAECARYETVKTYGNKSARTAVICWGSNKGAAVEAAEELDLKVVQPLCLSPFPVSQVAEAIAGAEKLIAVESNATGQLVRLMNLHGLSVHKTILKYDGRPFSVEELVSELRKAMK